MEKANKPAVFNFNKNRHCTCFCLRDFNFFLLLQTDLTQVPSRLEKEARTTSVKSEKKKGKEAATGPAAEVSSQPAQSIEGESSYWAWRKYCY